jgi:hypothetical protein
MISVLVFLKHDKNAPLFLENMHEKPLEFSRMHENKTYFCIFLNDQFFEFFGFFEILEKNQVFLIPDLYFTV